MTISTFLQPPRLALDAHDRCDRCGAQAQVCTAHLNGLLLWCGHCYRVNELTLMAESVDLVADSRTSKTAFI